MRSWFLALMLLAPLLLLAPPVAASRVEDPEIKHLLEFVRGSACDFIRNDKRHDARDAADHLASKYRRGRRWVNSADQFVSRIASKSTMSGDVYRVRCPGAAEQTSSAWLTGELQRFRTDGAAR